MRRSEIDPGLCGSCVNARAVLSARGSAFWLCRMHEHDRRWSKYPPLPVLQCPGYRGSSARGDSSG